MNEITSEYSLRKITQIIFFSCIVLMSSQVLAQLSGSYTIGSGGDYPTLNSAVGDLNTLGINGPVTFNILSGTYNEQLNLGVISGTSSTNTVTFQSNSGNASDVTITYAASGTTDNFVVKLDGSNYIIFKQLTLTSGSTTYARVVVLQNSAGNFTLSDNVLNGYASANTNNRYSVIHSINSGTLTNITIENNTINNGSNGIYLDAQSVSTGSLITGNIIQSRYRGIYLKDHEAPVVSFNTVLNSSSNYAIVLVNADKDLLVEKNSITSTNNSGKGISIENCDGDLPNNLLGTIANNFVQAKNIGIRLTNTTYNNVYHNSVNIENSPLTKSTLSAALNITPTCENLTILNNIFANKREGYAFNANNSSGGQIAVSDYNSLYTNGKYIGKWSNTNYITLSDFRAVTGTDANSTVAKPFYSSYTDLHANSSLLDNEGTPVSTITTDIDGESRSLTSPSIGADEFSAPGNRLNGIYTVGSGGDYLTLSDAVNDLYYKGISGAVTFNILNGTYSEQLDLIGSISGASVTNNVTFQSASGNAADVTINFPSISANDNFIFKFKSTEYIIVKNMTLVNGGTNYARVIFIENANGNLTFSGNVMNGYSTAGASLNQSLVYSSNSGNLNDLKFENNTLNNGSTGMYLYAGTASNNLVISNNIIQPKERGLYIKNFIAPKISSNNLSNSGSSYTIEMENNTANYLIEKNKITTSGGSGKGITVGNCDGTNLLHGTIVNNFIQAELFGLNVSGSDFVDIYHNSINMENNPLTFYTTSYALRIFTANTNVNVKNNILNNMRDGYAYVGSSGQITTSDYNDLFTTGSYIGTWDNVSYSNLTDFQTASSNESNSVVVKPFFTSRTDLHASSSLLDNEGTPITSVNVDIDGETRNAANPSIGADEYSAVFAPLSGVYTIGASGDFATVSEAVDALYIRSISGTVTFNILNGIYNEQLDLTGSVPGATNTNTITFQSNSGNPADATISYTPTGGVDNFVARFKSVEYITLNNLTITTGGTIYAKVVVLENSGNNLSFTGNVFNGYSGAIASISQSVIYGSVSSKLNNLTFENNTFNNGTNGIYLDVGSASDNLLIRGNSISPNFRGIFISNFNVPEISANLITNSGGDAGIELQNVIDNFIVKKNKITVTDDNGFGIILVNCSGSLNKRGTIVNNFVHAGKIGIKLTDSDSIDVYFNSVNIENNPSTDYTNGFAFKAETGNLDINVINNIFKNKRAGYAYIGSAGQGITSDYNNLYTSGANLGKWDGTNYTTFTDFKTASSIEANSYSEDVVFTSLSDLHIQSSPVPLNGTSLLAVTDDIDGEARNATPYIGADEINSPSVAVSVKIFLEGSYNSTNNNMNQNITPPFDSPYGIAPQTVNPIPPNVVDWVLLELRNKIDASIIEISRSAFILRNGTIVDIDGISTVAFPGASDTQYYIVVKHRNHLGVMSASVQSFGVTPTIYDFTTANTKFYGGSAGAVEIEPGVWGMIAGDANSDGVVDAVDKNNFWRVENGTAYDYTKYSDFNLDANLDAVDKNDFWRTNNGKSTQLP